MPFFSMIDRNFDRLSSKALLASHTIYAKFSSRSKRLNIRDVHQYPQSYVYYYIRYAKRVLPTFDEPILRKGLRRRRRYD